METDVKGWPPLKMALWKVLMDENLNDGHYIKAFKLIEKLYNAAQPPAAPVETNSPEQARESDCKTNPELTGHSPKERGERVLPHSSAEKEHDGGYVERSKVREILIGHDDDYREILETVLAEVDDLPIFSAVPQGASK
jgi:hypothetical protein